ncbi:fimbrial protein [Caenimonas aquaedulcis]|uniref:Type 1 fimbrial protein n=1 Tax=Caenimonas aquaedulcis TaxID=2793270 RepID=A0A931MJ94_9BURK|nr:fimbrial protein [Caenimonas aquaedulcis]MBG9390664.1 type 1 fimbrial protein [Caenimonas aquaedulcis]
MKKQLSALVAVAAIYAPLAAHASDGTINFTGKLVSTTCTVTNGGATALNVPLPPTATTSVNPTGGDTAFSLNITGCTGPTTATTYFEAGGNISASGRLINTAAATTPATGPANVELELLNGNGTTIALNAAYGSQNVTPAPITAGSAVANFIVRYYHTDATPVTAGDVLSSVTYSMVYL